MVDAEEAGSRRRVRRLRSLAEKRRIVELTMAPGASVAEIARGYAVNANQVFKWRLAFERGELSEPSAALLPVSVSRSSEAKIMTVEQSEEPRGVAGAIHIEIPGRATIRVERGADGVLLRCILESLHK